MSTETVENAVPRTAPLDGCPVCNSPDTKLMFSSHDRLHGVPGEYGYHVCKECGTIFQNPMVLQEDLHLCYPAVYAPYSLKREIPDVDFDSLPDGNFRSKLRKAIVETVKGKPTYGFEGSLGRLMAKSSFFRERAFYGLVIDELLPRGTGERFALDLGCGSGWLMQKLEKVGWQTEGLEWNENAAQIAREMTGCNVWAGDFRSVDLPKGKFDLIVLNHVIEHINEPKGVLLRVRELLADGGKAVLFYPNPHSSGSIHFKSNWFAWDPPRHLIFPSVEALGQFASKAGFSEAQIFTDSTFWGEQEQCIRSKAYKMGRHPETSRPFFNFSDRMRLVTTQILTSLGLHKGWEVVAVLKK